MRAAGVAARVRRAGLALPHLFLHLERDSESGDVSMVRDEETLPLASSRLHPLWAHCRCWRVAVPRPGSALDGHCIGNSHALAMLELARVGSQALAQRQAIRELSIEPRSQGWSGSTSRADEDCSDAGGKHKAKMDRRPAAERWDTRTRMTSAPLRQAQPPAGGATTSRVAVCAALA